MSHFLSDSRARPARSSAGFTVVELLVALTIVLLALRVTVSGLMSVKQIAPVTRDTSFALEAAKSMLEEMRGVDFFEVYARYNEDGADDPGGVGTAPGAHFPVQGLSLRTGDLDGFVGRIEFPASVGELREDVVDRDLGMPRDLNGDGAVDALDHALDYQLLPVRVIVEWSRASADRTLELTSLLVAQ